MQRDGRGGTRCRMEATTQLQKAGRAFLLRLVAEYGPIEAGTVLRRLADELEVLWRDGPSTGRERPSQSGASAVRN